MKKHISILFFGLFLSLSVWASVDYQHINSYATRLTLPHGGTITKDRTVDVKFYVMAPTNGVWVYLDMNEDGEIDNGDVQIFADENLNAALGSEHLYDYETVTCTIPESVPAGDYKWLVKVRGQQDHNEWTVPTVVRNYENTTYEYIKALGVAVDCAYESEYFGYSYVAEAYNGTTKNGKIRNEGIYSFGPAMGERNTSPYTGGHTWSSDDLANYYYEAGPFRTCTDDEGYVYICENRPQDDCEIKVFRLNPKNPTAAFDTVLTKTHIAKAESAMGISISRRVQSIAVGRDSKGKKILYVILAFVDTDGNSGGLSGQTGSLTGTSIMCDFDITDLANVHWNGHKIPMHQIPYVDETKKSLINVYNSIELGNHGDFWVFQSRQGAFDAYPGSMHFDKNWNCDFVITTGNPGGTTAAPNAYNSRGTGALTKDASILAIPIAAGTGAEAIRFYDVIYDTEDNSKVVGLSKKYDLSLPTKLSPVTVSNDYKTQHWVDGMDFDVANNLYFIGGTGKGKNVNYYASRLYVYALPKADNSHVTPARSSLTIKVGDVVTWHPYPVGHSVTNKDLWSAFQDGYNAWYMGDETATRIDERRAKQKIEFASTFVSPKNHSSGLVMEFMTHENSPWKWLGDYIIATLQPAGIPTNEELWEEFKVYFNEYYPTNSSNCLGVKFPRADQTIANVATFWPSNADGTQHVDPDANIMTNNNSKYKWLGDYILKVTNDQLAAGRFKNYKGLNTEIKWRFALTAFFNKKGINDTDYNGNADFSEAGKPENWGPYYVAPDGNQTLVTETAWKEAVHNFFNGLNEFTTAGQPNSWSDAWWNAYFPSVVPADYPLPVVQRDGYVFAGWYYGNETTYEINDPLNDIHVTKNGHLWARWLETCLHEGYVPATANNGFSQQEVAMAQVNRNEELINMLASKSDYPITVERKLQGGMYNTMCLPFAIIGRTKLNEIKDDNGASLLPSNTTSILVFQNTTIEPTASGESVLAFNFREMEEGETLKANVPFLIKPASDVTSRMHFWNPWISHATTPAASAGSYVTLVPVLWPTDIPSGEGTNNLILVANNRLARVSRTSTMLGLRGYFNGSDIPSNLAAAPAVLKITKRDGTSTYLDAVNMSTQTNNATKILVNGQIYILRDGRVYDIMGRSRSEQ